jgi:replicative DNA helicase
MVINKAPMFNTQERIKVQFDLITYDIFCRYVLQPTSFVRMEHLVNMRNLIKIIDPSTYENDPEKLKRIRFIYKALEARIENNINDRDLILTFVNGGLTFNVDFLDYNNIELNQNEIKYVHTIVSQTLQYQFMYRDIDVIMDICTRFKTTDFQNRGNIVQEFEGVIDALKTDLRHSKVNDSIIDMEFSLRDGEFENVITDSYNIIKNPSRRLITGMQALNEMIGGGFESGRFYMIMGTSGVGKSLTLLNIIYQMKRYNTHYKTKDPSKTPCIVLLTMENTIIETITRLFDLSIEGSLGMESYTCDEVIHMLRSEGQLVLNETSPIDIIIKYRPNRSVNTSYLYSMCDDLEDKGYEVICLVQDHIKRIRSVYENPDLRIELGDVVNEMKAFAAEKDIPVISNTHLNRSATQVVEEGLRKKTKDIAKSLGQANTGESMLIVDNSDCIIDITLDFDHEENRYMSFKLSKMRGKATSNRDYFAQPFAPGSTIRLVEDVGGIPQFKESLHMSPGFQNNTITKVSGSTTLTTDIDNIIEYDDNNDNTFSKTSYLFDMEQADRKQEPIKAISFFEEDDILNAIQELEAV